MGLTPGGSDFPPGSPVDAGLQWLVDFDRAVTAGMALKIPITPDQHARVSIASSFMVSAAKGTAAEFADLIDAHHYTDGFAFVPQGSPTNNTIDASSAFSRKDPTFDISFAVERQSAAEHSPHCRRQHLCRTTWSRSATSRSHSVC